MSGIDEQLPICHTCGESSYFIFRLRWNGSLYNIWLLSEKTMKSFRYSKPVIFSRHLVPESKRLEFIDMINGVKCHSCCNEENFNAQTKKMVNLLRNTFNRKGGLQSDETGH